MGCTNSSEELFSVVRQYAAMLRGCVHCKVLWLDIAHASRMTERSFWTLAEKIYLLNSANERLSASDLATFDIHFSSTLCASCINVLCGHKYRAKQHEEGNFPCFGSATNGYCDQGSCKYKCTCITHQNANPGTRQYFDHLLSQMKAASIVVARE